MGIEVLYAHNVKKAYNGTFALAGVDFSMKTGEIHSLLGPNGAGKTTFIKILATLLKKDAGEVQIFGYDLDTQEHAIRHVLGYVGQDTERSAYARLTPVENLRFFGALRGLSKKIINERIELLSAYFEFEENLHKQFMHLSGGQKQVVVIMRALLHDPPIIFLDEPTKGLDPLISKRIRKFLKDYAKNEQKSLLLTSHIMSEVEQLSDRVSLIHNGKIPITGTTEELKNAVGVSDFVALDKRGLTSTVIDDILDLDLVVNSMEREENWVSFGVSDLFDGTQQILQLLKTNNVKTGFKQHSVTMEEAFVHHVGVLDEHFD